MVKYKKPLTFDLLKRLKYISPKEKHPSNVTLNMRYLNLYEVTTTSPTKIKDMENNFKVNVTIPGKFLGKRTKIQDVPIRTPIKNNINISENLQLCSRPKYTNVKFLPNKIELRLNEHRKPPSGFDYKYKDEYLDVPNFVFPPDDRHIYNDTDFLW
ncbi:MAG: hypothetical protein ACPKPY_03120 [Nitrososphaeraceae archaeon]